MAVLPFPRVPIVVEGSPKGIFAFTVTDSELRGIKPGDVLCCRPLRKGDRPKHVICEIDGVLIAKRFVDVEVFVAVVYAVQKGWML